MGFATRGARLARGLAAASPLASDAAGVVPVAALLALFLATARGLALSGSPPDSLVVADSVAALGFLGARGFFTAGASEEFEAGVPGADADAAGAEAGDAFLGAALVSEDATTGFEAAGCAEGVGAAAGAEFSTGAFAGLLLAGLAAAGSREALSPDSGPR